MEDLEKWLQLYPNIMDLSFKMLTALVAMISLWRLFVNLHTQRRIEKSKLMIELTKATAEFSKLIVDLENIEPGTDFKCEEYQARNFLRLLETTMLLIEEKTVTDEEIFPLLAYRTFTFLNSKLVIEKFLSGPGNRQTARHCAAFALYHRLFRYLVLRFKEKNLQWALENYNLVRDGEVFDKDKHLYWSKLMDNAIKVYIRHKGRNGKVTKKGLDRNRNRVEKWFQNDFAA